MIGVKFDDKAFAKDMKSMLDYSAGFLEGAKSGKMKLLENLGEGFKEMLGKFIDSMATVNPSKLHHVYEWHNNGDPGSRLFDISFTVSTINGLSMFSDFRQSTTVSKSSNVPFFDKANIMERGISMTVRPRNSTVLSFDINGKAVYTKKPVVVTEPGGPDVQGGFNDAFDMFFNQYLSQSMLYSSGLGQHLSSPKEFVTNFSRAKTGGKSTGYRVGYRWISRGSINFA